MHTEPDRLRRELLALPAMKRRPLHMPGHKRRTVPAPGLPVDWDITEIQGADDLHWSDGILAGAMERTAALWGAARSWYLVNGSTCGILAGIAALAPRGSRVICARNCHKSVFHALELGQLTPTWLLPPVDRDFGVFASVPPAAVERALRETPEARAVILTSPTYEGCISDLAAIAALCRDRGVPLLVDEAHGAHLGLSPHFPAGALAAGADVVIQSAHKTLPSLTQTALLHLSPGSLADPERIERQLDIYESSSPSYLLLSSLDGCTGLLAEHGETWFAQWRQRLDRFYAGARAWKRLRLFTGGPAVYAHDPGKLLLSAAALGLTGAALAEALRAGGFEPEMVLGNNVLCMTSPCDAPDTLELLSSLLSDLDARGPVGPPLPPRPALPEVPPRRVLSGAEAEDAPAEDVPLSRAGGRVAAEAVWAYPPGVPMVLPGELLPPETAALLAAWEAEGARLVRTGARPLTKHIKCVK